MMGPRNLRIDVDFCTVYRVSVLVILKSVRSVMHNQRVWGDVELFLSDSIEIKLENHERSSRDILRSVTTHCSNICVSFDVFILDSVLVTGFSNIKYSPFSKRNRS